LRCPHIELESRCEADGHKYQEKKAA